MLIYNTTKEEILNALYEVNKAYKDNIRLDNIEAKNNKQTTFSLKLGVNSSSKYGARVSHSGRRLCAASWQVFRDFMSWLYFQNTDIRIRTSITVYENRQDFKNRFQSTFNTPIGNGKTIGQTSVLLDGSKPY